MTEAMDLLSFGIGMSANWMGPPTVFTTSAFCVAADMALAGWESGAWKQSRAEQTEEQQQRRARATGGTVRRGWTQNDGGVVEGGQRAEVESERAEREETGTEPDGHRATPHVWEGANVM